MATKGRYQKDKTADKNEVQPAADKRGGKKVADQTVADKKGGNKQTQQPNTDKRGGKKEAEPPTTDKRGGNKQTQQPSTDKRGGKKEADKRGGKQAAEPDTRSTIPAPLPLDRPEFITDFSGKPRYRVTDIPTGPNVESLFAIEDFPLGKARKQHRPIPAIADEKTIATNDKTTEQKQPTVTQNTAVKQEHRPTAEEEKALKSYFKDLDRVGAKLALVNEKVNHFDSGWKNVPNRVEKAEEKMGDRGYQMDELEYRNKLHSAKIHELERELENVRVENHKIRGQLVGHDSHGGYGRDAYRENGYTDRQDYPDRHENGQYPYQSQNRHEGQGQNRGQGQGIDIYNQGPRFRGDGRPLAENEQHRAAHGHAGPDGEEYWGFNKFYDPKMVTSYRREQVPYYTRQEEKQTQQQPGGLYIVRFHDSGFEDVKVALSEQQTIVRSYNGHIIGVARRNHILSLEGDADWTFSRQQPATSRGGVPIRHVEDAIAVYWFTNYDKAYYFSHNSAKNRFRNQSFPTPQSWEAHFIPLLSPPLLKTMDTYLILELVNADRYKPENVQQFEAEARQAILRYQPNCLPFVVSCPGNRYSPIKPGPHGNLFKHKSRIFLSRLGSLDDVVDLWRNGVVQGVLSKWGLTGPLNASAFALRDWTDH